MSEEFLNEIAQSYEENGETDATPIRLAKSEQRIREIEAANRSLRARIAEVEAERDAAKAKLDEVGMVVCCANDFEQFDPVQLVKDQMAQYHADLDAAKAEAERDKGIAQEFHRHITSLESERDNAVRYTELLIQERDAAKKRSEFFEKEAMNWGHQNAFIGSKLERAEAALESARAGEARAVEALRKITDAGWPPESEDVSHGPDCTCQFCDRNRLLEEVEAILESAQPTLDWLAQREREAAAEAWRERDKQPEWNLNDTNGLVAKYREHRLRVILSQEKPERKYLSEVCQHAALKHYDYYPTLDAAKQAAIAWVDGQEGK